MTRSTLTFLSFILAASHASAVPAIRSLGTLGNPPASGGWTNAVSSDGLTITGYGNAVIPPSGVAVTLGAVARLSLTLDGNYTSLPPISSASPFNTSGFAYASSNLSAGRVTVGTSSNTSGVSHATLWTANSAIIDLVPSNQSTYSAAFDVTPDGHFAVGALGNTPIRWTLSPAISYQSMNLGTYAFALPVGVSADGLITVGRAGPSPLQPTSAVYWRSDFPPQPIPFLPGAVTASASAVSDDGLTIVGYMQNTPGNTQPFRGFISRFSQGRREAHPLYPGASNLVSCVSADGALFGGYDQPTDSSSTRRALLWNRPGNPRLLSDILTSLSVDLSGWTLSHIRGISADGTIISGFGTLNGAAVSFFVTLPRPCAADFNLDYTIDFFDYLDFVNEFSRASLEADFNLDGAIDFFDYLDFVQAFNAAC